MIRAHYQLDQAEEKLTQWENAVRRLLDLGTVGRRNRLGENRLDRADDVTVSEVSEFVTYGYTTDRVTAKVQGTACTYDVRITVTQKARGYHCTCRDSQERGRQVGPCKHTLALAERLQENELVVEARNIQDERDSDEPDHLRGVVPGTYAYTARMMAGPNPSREEGEFWDSWKDQMKEGWGMGA